MLSLIIDNESKTYKLTLRGNETISTYRWKWLVAGLKGINTFTVAGWIEWIVVL